MYSWSAWLSGGMAEIYLAKEFGLQFEKLVVVKRIRSDFENNENLTRMFLDEARIAATLQHQNVVQMYDVGEEDGHYFISMEYLDGEDCRSIYKAVRRARTQVPYDVALAIVLGAAQGASLRAQQEGL